MTKRQNAHRKKYKKGEILQTIAADLETTMPLLALAWCLKNKNVSTVILGASKLSQLRENLKASAVKNKLTNDVMTTIEEVLDNKPLAPTF